MEEGCRAKDQIVFRRLYDDVDTSKSPGIGKGTGTWKELGKELEVYIKKYLFNNLQGFRLAGKVEDFVSVIDV